MGVEGGVLFPYLLCLSQKTHFWSIKVVMEGTQTPQLPRNENALKPLPDQCLVRAL